MQLKPLPKIALVFILFVLVAFGLKAGVERGLVPAPGIVRSVMPIVPDEKPITVQRDADWEMSQRILQAEGYSYGDDGLLKYRQPDDTTGYPALDNVLRYVWNNCGTLMLVFGLLAGLSVLGIRLNADSDTHNEQMRREAEELESPGLSDDIHEPFDAPEGMQPATQYVPIRTRR
jgi:hypothetical protein